ncbi:helix-turn-helix domain-containing protein [Streptomyces qinzhouensis]|uniref:Helix-turn-helix domain-containing protein n=1 Tax=Streptomyces qinzhouensis TaxID=2599401 RepID=A0A5B8J868_9ACTN|nr:helix-turn-helix domain-containing protein [Streptomyces qinzhouensis]QDY77527.1 helix-turn-helix domain-containing protein [Streptomyces qinzhouensis]
MSTAVRTIEPLLYTPEEAAVALRMGRSTLYELMAAGVLEYVKQGRSRRIRVSTLKAYVATLNAS